jgi:hypothetical protein
MFLRGTTQNRKAGSYQADALQGHRHDMEAKGGTPLWDSTQGTGPSRRAAKPKYKNRNGLKILGPINDGANGRPRIADETRPKNVAVYFYIKIK